MRRLAGAAALLLAGWSGGAIAAQAQATADAPGQRVLLDTGWRFQRGDPPGFDSRTLDYDVRPDVAASADGKDADARPDAAVRTDGGQHRVLKPWILPTGNAFLGDARQRHVRPAHAPDVSPPYASAQWDDSRWQAVTLPHDWAIAGPFLVDGPYGGMGRLPSWGIGWYRRQLPIAAGDAGQSIFLDLDGAMSYATVWLNGQLVGGWPYGYNSWRVDLTPYVQPGGVNQLAIRLDNPPDSARWYPGGGLYRNVWLSKSNPVHLAQWGQFITTPQVSTQQARVHIATRVDNDSARAMDVEVSTQIRAVDARGQAIGPLVAQLPTQRLHIAAHSSGDVKAETRIVQPRLWGPPPTQTPHRYVAETTVHSGGRLLDQRHTRFGIRSVRFDANQGVLINGERIVIRGVNNHHDLGALGAAFNRRAAQRQLQILQQMGANAIRMAHNPPDPQLLELTDQMGLLVVDEIFDSWERKKTPLDFHLIFPDWHEQDLRAMVRRDRNHPSIILWSVGNEVGEQYTGAEGAAIGRRLHDIARQEDPTRPTTASMNWAKPDMPFAAAFDVINLNYQGEGIRQDPEFEGTDRIRTPPQYPAFHSTYPDKAILSSETASALSSRGVYLFPVSPAQSAPVREGRGGDAARRQVSAYELHAVDFGSSADKVFAALDRHPYVAGEFVWTGFDYLGEPTPYYASRSSYSGIVDLAGFAKDRYYLYQSRWRPDLPMAHLLPHWTWPGREGQITPVHVFTSGDEAELFVNGVSQGRKKKAPFEYRLRWDEVRYQPGDVRVQVWRDGQPWAEDRVQTAGAPVRLEASVDRAGIASDGRDLAFVTVRVLDDAGREVPTADTLMQLRLEGAGEIVATDNGDPTDMTAFVSPQRRAFSGQLLAIVRARAGQPGELVLHAQADGLQPARIIIHAQPEAIP